VATDAQVLESPSTGELSRTKIGMLRKIQATRAMMVAMAAVAIPHVANGYLPESVDCLRANPAEKLRALSRGETFKGLEIAHGVLGHAIYADLEVNMVAEAVAGISDVADDISLTHLGTD